MDKDIEQFGGTFIIDYKGDTKFQNELTFFSSKLGEFLLNDLNFEDNLFNNNNHLGNNDIELHQSDKHNKHIFDIDTAHDGINPHKRASANLENKLVSDVEYKDKIRASSVIIPRTDLINIDNSYSIIKDAGPGSVLLSLSNLIDSAGTPDFNKYKEIKGTDYDLNANGDCLKELKTFLNDDSLKKLPRNFTLDDNACADTDSSISRADLKLYQFIQEKNNFFNFKMLWEDAADGSPEKDLKRLWDSFQTDPKFKNLYLMNFIWQTNLYYCIKKCIEPKGTGPEENNKSRYSKGLGFLNRIVFSEFEKNKTSMTPIFSMNGSYRPSSDRNNSRTTLLEHISDVFLHLFNTEKYITDGDYDRYIYQKNNKMQGSNTFLVSQSAIAKGIKSLLSKNPDFSGNAKFLSSNIQSRSGEGTVLNADFTITSLINIYFGYWTFAKGRPRKDFFPYLDNAVFMLRMLKFMGDRSHIVISKLIKKSGDLRDHILLTLDRPLQVSVVKENLNGLFKLQAQHDLIFTDSSNDQSIVKPFSTYKSSRLLLYAPNMSFTNLVDIISANFVYTLLWDYLAYEGGNISVLNTVFYIYIVNNEENVLKREYKATVKIRNGRYSTEMDKNNPDPKEITEKSQILNDFIKNFAFTPNGYTWEYWDSQDDNWGRMQVNIGCGFVSEFTEGGVFANSPYTIYITGQDNMDIADAEVRRTMDDALGRLETRIGMPNSDDDAHVPEDVPQRDTSVPSNENSVPIQKLAKKFSKKGDNRYKMGDILRITKRFINDLDEVKEKELIGTVIKDYEQGIGDLLVNIDHIDYYTNFANMPEGDARYKNLPPPMKKTPKKVNLNDILTLNTDTQTTTVVIPNNASISDVISDYTKNLTKFLEIDSKEFYSTFNYEYIPILEKLLKTDVCIMDIRKDLNYLLSAKDHPLSMFNNDVAVQSMVSSGPPDLPEEKKTNNPVIGFYYRVCQKNDFSAPKTQKYLKVVLAILDRLQLLKKYSGQEGDIKDNHSPLILKERAYDEYIKLKRILAQDLTLIQLNNSLNTKFVIDEKEATNEGENINYVKLDYVLPKSVDDIGGYILFDVQKIVNKYFVTQGAVKMYAKNCWDNHKKVLGDYQCKHMRRANKTGNLKATKKHKEREETLRNLREVRNRLIESKLFSSEENNKDQNEQTQEMAINCHPPWLEDNILQEFLKTVADRAYELDQFFDMTPGKQTEGSNMVSQFGGNSSDNNFHIHFFDLISKFFNKALEIYYILLYYNNEYNRDKGNHPSTDFADLYNGFLDILNSKNLKTEGREPEELYKVPPPPPQEVTLPESQSQSPQPSTPQPRTPQPSPLGQSPGSTKSVIEKFPRRPPSDNVPRRRSDTTTVSPGTLASQPDSPATLPIFPQTQQPQPLSPDPEGCEGWGLTKDGHQYEHIASKTKQEHNPYTTIETDFKISFDIFDSNIYSFPDLFGDNISDDDIFHESTESSKLKEFHIYMQQKSDAIKNIFDKNNIVKNIEIENVKDLSNFTNTLLDSEQFCNNQYIYILEYLMNIYFEKLYLSIQHSPPEDLPPQDEAKSGGATPPPKKKAPDGTWPTPRRPMDEDSDSDPEAAAPPPTAAPVVYGAPGNTSYAPAQPQATAPAQPQATPKAPPPATPPATPPGQPPAKKHRQHSPNVLGQEHVKKLRPLGWEHGKKLKFEQFHKYVFSITKSADGPAADLKNKLPEFSP